MLRVGLTGGLGSGKSTAARMFAAHGAHVLSSDEIGRDLMQPGQPVYAAIVAHFGGSIVATDGSLDRAALARIAFGPKEVGGGRVEELNAIVHPAVIDRQAALIDEIAARDPNAVVMVESALLFETKHGGAGGWHKRFNKIILVTAPTELRIARFIARIADANDLTAAAAAALEADARRRIGQQAGDEIKLAHADYIVKNDGSLADLAHQVDAVWHTLTSEG